MMHVKIMRGKNDDTREKVDEGVDTVEWVAQKKVVGSTDNIM